MNIIAEAVRDAANKAIDSICVDENMTCISCELNKFRFNKYVRICFHYNEDNAVTYRVQTGIGEGTRVLGPADEDRDITNEAALMEIKSRFEELGGMFNETVCYKA